jgi:hypothetical protein
VGVEVGNEGVEVIGGWLAGFYQVFECLLSGMGPSETCKSPIWPEKTAASFTRARSMVEGVALHVEGSNQVGVSWGLRHVRPWA